MPEEYEIQAVMVNAACDRETAIKALKQTNGRIGFAIKRVILLSYAESLSCVYCGEPLSGNWKFCPECGKGIGGGPCSTTL